MSSNMRRKKVEKKLKQCQLILINKGENMLKVDKNKCIGCGLCVSICSKGFEIKNGKASVKNRNVKCINDAISSCPVKAINK